MRIITSKQQEAVRDHLVNIIESILHKDGIERLDCIEDVAHIALIIGSRELAEKVYERMWGDRR